MKASLQTLLGCALLLAFASAGRSAPAQAPAKDDLVIAGEGLKAPPGFTVSLVASDPMVACPAAMCAAPDGRIFVCEEYIHAEIKDRKRDLVKVLVGAKSGGAATKAIPLADDLNSVQGLAFHDGKLYIAHSPHISVLPVSADNQAGALTHLVTGVGAGPKGFSPSHQASGLLVQDGKLYICFGDQGCDVQTKEGRRIRLDSGGILHCDLDGARLEIFAHGFRNIYGIAMDPLGSAFTRENDNDGGGYNCRSYHLIKGGYYGWPFRYQEADRENYVVDVLPAARDQGHGSSTGCLWVENAKFPAPFNRGVLFADWTKAKVLHSAPVLKGATFDLPENELVADASVPKAKYQFRPTAVALAPDGSLLIADMATLWLHSREPVGRVLRLRYTGTAAATPPSLAASALNATAPVETLLNKLGSSDTAERARAALLLGEARHATATPTLLKLLSDADALVRLHAATALGELRLPTSTAPLARAFATEPDRWVRFALVRALRANGDGPGFLSALESAPASVQADLLHALRDDFDAGSVASLLKLTEPKSQPAVRAQATEFLGLVAKRSWHKRGGDPVPKLPTPTESWEATDTILPRLHTLLRDADADVRLASLHALQRLNDTSVVRTVLADLQAGKLQLNDDTALMLIRSAGNEPAELTVADYLKASIGADAVRVEAARTLALGKQPASLDALRGAAFAPSSSADLRLAALDALGRRKDSASTPQLLAALPSAPPTLQSATARALGLIYANATNAAPSVRDALLAATASTDRNVKAQGLVAVWRLGDPASLEAVLARLLALTPADDDLQREVISAVSGGPRAQVEPLLLFLLEGNQLGRNAGSAAISPLRNWARSDFGWGNLKWQRDFARPKLAEYRARTYPQWKLPATTTSATPAAEDPEQRIARLTKAALAASGDTKRGGDVFRKSSCLLCHKVNGEGALVGPELSGIGAKYARAALIESVLVPSAQIFEGYQLTDLHLKDGEVVSGIIQSEDATKLTVVSAGGLAQTVPARDVLRRVKSRFSAMPDGLANAMTDQEFFDLIVFLESLRAK